VTPAVDQPRSRAIGFWLRPTDDDVAVRALHGRSCPRISDYEGRHVARVLCDIDGAYAAVDRDRPLRDEDLHAFVDGAWRVFNDDRDWRGLFQRLLGNGHTALRDDVTHTDLHLAVLDLDKAEYREAGATSPAGREAAGLDVRRAKRRVANCLRLVQRPVAAQDATPVRQMRATLTQSFYRLADLLDAVQAIRDRQRDARADTGKGPPDDAVNAELRYARGDLVRHGDRLFNTLCASQAAVDDGVAELVEHFAAHEELRRSHISNGVKALRNYWEGLRLMVDSVSTTDHARRRDRRMNELAARAPSPPRQTQPALRNTASTFPPVPAFTEDDLDEAVREALRRPAYPCMRQAGRRYFTARSVYALCQPRERAFMVMVPQSDVLAALERGVLAGCVAKELLDHGDRMMPVYALIED
jgi:hypothetical protein